MCFQEQIWQSQSKVNVDLFLLIVKVVILNNQTFI